MNSNAFKLSYGPVTIADLAVPPGQGKETKLELNTDNVLAELDAFPYLIDCALKVFEDVYVFRVPCSLSIGMVPGFTISLDDYKLLVSSPENVRNQ